MYEFCIDRAHSLSHNLASNPMPYEGLLKAHVSDLVGKERDPALSMDRIEDGHVGYVRTVQWSAGTRDR